MQTAFTLFRQHGGKARRHRKRAREKVPTTAEEEAIVAALAKTRGDSLSGAHNDDEDVRDVDEELIPIARKQKVSINIFEDVDDRWVLNGAWKCDVFFFSQSCAVRRMTVFISRCESNYIKSRVHGVLKLYIRAALRMQSAKPGHRGTVKGALTMADE